MFPTKLASTFAMAGLLSVASIGFAGDDRMTSDQVKMEKERIEAQYDAAKKQCNAMKGKSEDVCEERAKGDRKVAEADLQYRRSGEAKDREKLERARADAAYEVAKERCDQMNGAAEDQCEKDAKAAHQKAVDAAKAMAG